MKSPLDAYTFRARLQPALIAAVPIPLAIIAAYPGGPDWWTPLWTLLVACGATYLLAELGRDRGKRNEEELFRRWGGKPTTLRLRHRGAANPTLLQRYHTKLMELRADLLLPDAKSEAEDPRAADERYDSAAAYLRERTRDQTRFPLVFEELCNYGFRRNLWGLKPLGLGAVSFGLALTIGTLALHLRGHIEIALPPLLACATLQLLIGFVWIVRITPDWPRPAAVAYADALVAAVERL